MRRTQYTILLVCEGYAEEAYARVMRDLYLPRGCGTALQPRNARGYGAAGALNLAVQLQKQTAHDAYGILIDTDQHWTDDDRARARECGIVAIENSPCLEATLLLIDGERARHQSRENKDVFADRYNGPAHRDGVISRHFTREKIDAARTRVPAVDAFLRLIRI